jgi:hypothetical protein
MPADAGGNALLINRLEQRFHFSSAPGVTHVGPRFFHAS